MRDTFEQALSAVLKHEGGWADHPKDPGGATMKGVTLATYRQYKPGATKDQLRNISEAELQRIYRDGYWNKVKGDDLPAGLDYAVFDYAVNSGPGRAAKALQKLVGVPQDGVIGPKTLGAVNDVHPANLSSLINAYCDGRMAFLRGLGTFSTFGKGWTSRVSGVRGLALKMLKVEPPKLQPAPPLPDIDHYPQPSVAPLPVEPAALPQTPAESTARVLPKALIGFAIVAALAAAAWFVFNANIIPS